MDEPAFDFQGVFDEDYLFFYGTFLTDERSDADTAMITRLLGLERGARVLDLACGHGRIANRLAAAGWDVVGLDASPLFLERARSDAERCHVDVAYVRGDMRALPLGEARFDHIVNWFTAFGYFSDEGNREVLRQARRVLRPGGTLLLDLNARDWVLKNLQQTTSLERDDGLMIDRHAYDASTGRMENERIVVRDGAVRRMPYGVRMFPLTEIRDWLLAAGFIAVAGFDQDGEPFGDGARRMRVLATA